MMPATLVELRSVHMREPVAAEFMGPVAALEARFGAALAAVLLYGSCRRQQEPAAGVVDLYVIVEDYVSAHRGRLSRWANALLPPNVYYLESGAVDAPLRVKYAVLSRGDFRRLNGRAFHSYFWARFCQPVTLLHARDPGVGAEIAESLASATLQFLRQTTPLLGSAPVPASGVFANGFRLTYSAELRPESTDRADLLVHEEQAFLEAALAVALPGVPELARGDDGLFRSLVTPSRQRLCRHAWRLRRIQGAMLSLLRLAKAAFTFAGGVDYAAWKVARHTGVHIDVTPRLRRHPLLFGWRVIWQLIRRGALR